MCLLLEQKAEYTEELNQRGIKVKDSDKAQDLKAKLQSELKGMFDKLWNLTNNKDQISFLITATTIKAWWMAWNA